MKVSFFDIKLLKSTGSFILLESSILGGFTIFVNDFVIMHKIESLLILITSFMIYHIIKYLHSNKLRTITLKIKNSTFKIITDDIFNQNELKVINFNEYFDTVVDDKLIAKNSLNGKFILNNVRDVKELDKVIEDTLSECPCQVNDKRKQGKKKKYQLGSIVEYNNEFLLTALTKFDNDNRACLELRDYLLFLMNFWDSLDKIYANRSVAITLFGSSSITRFKDSNDITDQDLIEIILWTFRVSKIKFKYPTTITLVLTDDLLNRINLYDLKERYKNGI